MYLRERLRLTTNRRPQGPGTSSGSTLDEDRRELTVRLRGFLSILLEHAELPAELKNLPVVFPSTSLMDARSLEDHTHRAAFATPGTLDAIELFARTVSCCARLNPLPLPNLAAIEDPPPQHVLLAWMALRGDQVPGMTVGELLAGR